MVDMLSMSRASNVTSARRPKPFVAKQMFNVFTALSSPTSPALSSDSEAGSPMRSSPHHPIPGVGITVSPLSGGASSSLSTALSGEATSAMRRSSANANGLNGPRPSPLAVALQMRTENVVLTSQVEARSPLKSPSCRSPVVQISPKRHSPQGNARLYGTNEGKATYVC